MPKLEVAQLEGWLIKKHSNENKSMFSLSSESRRWFKVREVKGIEEKELTLAYYASHRAKEAKGFIYLRDVTSIRATEDLSITLKSPARILTVFAETMVEHLFWLEGLVHLCAAAEVSTGPNGECRLHILHHTASIFILLQRLFSFFWIFYYDLFSAIFNR
jgi:hypothetical protein